MAVCEWQAGRGLPTCYPDRRRLSRAGTRPVGRYAFRPPGFVSRVSIAAAFLFATVLSLAQVAPKPVLWTDPGDIHSKDLYWGPGGREHQPKFPVEFEEEDLHGTSPKLEVRDAEGKKWSAKMGLEPKPETVASRLLWAVGYVGNYDYYYPKLRVDNVPSNLQRSARFVSHGEVTNVRLQRHPKDLENVSGWNWKKNPFYGTREFNGLRVMMGLIGNWDLKDDNNAVFNDEKHPGRQVYSVSDVGTAMGTPGKSWNDRVSKGNLSVYKRTKLLKHVHKDHVDLNFPKCPPFTFIFPQFEWGFYFRQVRMRWIGKNIPRKDAKWIGSLLAQLSQDQIRDAFRAAGHSPAEIDDYTAAVLSRIKELNSL